MLEILERMISYYMRVDAGAEKTIERGWEKRSTAKIDR